jgi:threonine dehydrogenase-like Zn-dependent dehydrogenase
MRAAIYNGPHSIEVGERPDPLIDEPTDALVRVVLSCVCGSDLWYYRGESTHDLGPIGHEFIGVVEEVGRDVRGIENGDFVIAPFIYCDGTCAHCRAGVTSQCVHGAAFGNHGIDGGQGEAVRVPLAGSTLVRVPGSGHSEETMKSLLTLSDVMCTGHHAAVSAGVSEGSVVAVIGDGAVGLCGVIAARRLGASRIIALSRHPSRQKLAAAFGATDILSERGDAAIEAVLELTHGVGVDAALECVGTGQSVATSLAVTRPGSMVGIVGVPHGVDASIADTIVFRNVGLRGGVAPARAYIPELLGDVLEGRINPGLVFDFETDLDGVAEAYAAMDERRAIKSLLRIGKKASQ